MKTSNIIRQSLLRQARAVSRIVQVCNRSVSSTISSSSSSSLSTSYTFSSTFPTSSVRSFSSTSSSNVLLIADHDNSTLSSSTLHTLTAAKQLGSSVTVLVAGENCSSVATQASQLNGVTKVLHVDSPLYSHWLPESFSTLLHSLSSSSSYTHIVGATNAVSKNALPRLGLLLDVQPVTDVIEIKDTNTFKRPVYAGNAIATVQSVDTIKVLTVRPTNFEKSATGTSSAPIEKVNASSPAEADSKTQWVKDEVTKSDRPQLANARIVVSGGRALKSKENFKIVEDLADALGGAVGASRAAVDAGYVPNDYQVGQTGKVVAPDLYIAAGISGAIQHLAGMKDSKVIVAINKDKEAPIFQVSDFGLEADLFKALPEMTEMVKKA